MYKGENNHICSVPFQGDEGFEKQIDRLMEITDYMVKKIKSMPDKFYLILEPEMVNVSFWYLPTRVRNVPHDEKRIRILGEVSVFVLIKNLCYNLVGLNYCSLFFMFLHNFI